MNTGFLGLAVATVLTVYGIETFLALIGHHDECLVATVLTVYGIETDKLGHNPLDEVLQQYLPFTVLKRFSITIESFCKFMLQQYLPFTVLKLKTVQSPLQVLVKVATVLTVYGIETLILRIA